MFNASSPFWKADFQIKSTDRPVPSIMARSPAASRTPVPSPAGGPGSAGPKVTTELATGTYSMVYGVTTVQCHFCTVSLLYSVTPVQCHSCTVSLLYSVTPVQCHSYTVSLLYWCSFRYCIPGDLNPVPNAWSS